MMFDVILITGFETLGGGGRGKCPTELITFVLIVYAAFGQVGKGRDVGLQQTYKFEAKLSQVR